jgi:Ca2+-binding RTX toxin-like protein
MGNIEAYGVLGSQITVNMTSGGTDQSRVVGLADGGFVVVWQASIANSTRFNLEIRAQRFDANGGFVGGEFIVAQVAGHQMSAPSVAAIPTGGFVVTWGDSVSGARVRVYDANGSAAGEEFGAQTTVLTTVLQTDVAVLSTGEYLVTWDVGIPGGAGQPMSYDSYARLFGASGALTDVFPISTSANAAQRTSRVIALEAGGFAVTWTDSRPIDGAEYGYEVMLRLYDANGNAVGEEIHVNATQLGTQADSEITALVHGGFVVTWVNFASATPTVVAQRFDNSGAKIGDEIVASPQSGGATTPAIVALADGGFALSWAQEYINENGVSARAILVQRYTADGAPLGTAVPISSPDAISTQQPSLAKLESGRLVGVWTDYTNNPYSNSFLPLKAIVVDPLTSIMGSDVADILTGTGGYLAIEGLGDDDTLTGSDGIDLIDGGTGDDTIFGGGGDDQIWGDAGDDDINGGAGYDQIWGGDGDDRIDGGTGNTYHSLNGEAGNDILRAQEGSGWLSGGEGDDTLVADHGEFTIFGDGGNDHLTLTNAISSAWIVAGDGDDVIVAASFRGVFANLNIQGGNGDDDISVSGFPAGTVTAGDGNDILRLANGGLNVTLGAGKDLVLIDAGTGGMTIRDFKAGEAGDRIDLSVYGADPFGTGTLVMTQAGIWVVLIEHPASGTRYVLENVQVSDLSAYNLNVSNPGYAPVGTVLQDSFWEYPILDVPGDLVGADGDDTIRGFGGDDTLFGGGGNDRIEGGLHDDLLDGGTGIDTMLGGDGDDIYVVDSLGDIVTELAGEGNDTVRTALAEYVLPDHVENLVYTGTATASLTGNGADNSLIGNTGPDLFLLQHGGRDSAMGGGGSDGFFLGAALDILDRIDGAAGIDDQVGLQGNYAGYTFGASNLVDIETLALMSASDTRFGATGLGTFSYDLKTLDTNVAAMARLTVNANTLRAGENVTFDGSAETDAMFRLILGAGDDTVIGGAHDDVFYGRLGADTLTGGTGNDEFHYRAFAESTAASMDRILDFTAGDRIDLSVIDADTSTNDNDAFRFIGAAEFSRSAGELRAVFANGLWRVEGDVDGDGAADFVLAVTTTAGHVLGGVDFSL